jgi:hypothetical protein
MIRSSSSPLWGLIGLLTGCLLAACSQNRGSQPAAFFPQSNEVGQWTKVGETRTFKADDLWQYIDGDADKYIRAGVLATLTANYRYDDSFDAVADIHVMANARGPQQIMDSESSAGSHALALGDSGRSYGASLIFRKGPYLIRLVAYKQSQDVPQALTDLGRGIERKLPASR